MSMVIHTTRTAPITDERIKCFTGTSAFLTESAPAQQHSAEWCRRDRIVASAFVVSSKRGGPALDEIEAGAVGGCEMKREARVANEPALDRRCLVGRGVT